MIAFFVDPVYYMIEGFIQIGKVNNLRSLTVEAPVSSITGKPCKIITMEEKDVPFNYTVLYEVEKYLLYPTKRFYRRPYFKIKVFENNEEVNPMFLEVEKEYTVEVSLENPDGIYWGDTIKTVKIKDRTGFLKEFRKSKAVDLDRKKKFRFKISSKFPGVFKLRVKDLNFLAYVSILEGKFVP